MPNMISGRSSQYGSITVYYYLSDADIASLKSNSPRANPKSGYPYRSLIVHDVLPSNDGEDSKRWDISILAFLDNGVTLYKAGVSELDDAKDPTADELKGRCLVKPLYLPEHLPPPPPPPPPTPRDEHGQPINPDTPTGPGGPGGDPDDD